MPRLYQRVEELATAAVPVYLSPLRSLRISEGAPRDYVFRKTAYSLSFGAWDTVLLSRIRNVNAFFPFLKIGRSIPHH